jgi:hypothetical protein
MKNATCEGGLP